MLKLLKQKPGIYLVKKLNKITELLINSNEVKRYFRLEKVINDNPKIRDEYQKILKIQRESVRKNIFSGYNSIIDEFKNGVLIGEYLELIEDINNDLLMIKSIIEDGINLDLIA